ncbi:MAG: alpha/beta hydrolase [Deltaproteobacteria bacterium]|nr:alpha/beta hydrolase [Deltaproteobacteria bacterium]
MPCAAMQRLDIRYDYFLSKTGSASAQIIVVHGLNTRPEVMDPLAKMLSSDGYDVFRLRLSRPIIGNGGNLASLWVSELNSLYCELQNRNPNLPIYNLSFSLGSAVTLAFVKSHPNTTFKKKVFLAPAVTLHNYSLPFQLLAPLLPGTVKLPSVAPVAYREKSFTRIAEYHAVFLLTKYIRSGSTGRYRSGEVLVLQNPSDELVSWKKLKRWLISENLDWQLYELSERGDENLPKHIIIDEQSLGAAGWNTITDQIREFYRSGSNNVGLILGEQPSALQ